MCKTQYIIADNSDYSILTLQLIARIFFWKYGLQVWLVDCGFWIMVSRYIVQHKIKKPSRCQALYSTQNNYYLFITYIVTSKPKRISVAAGVVHIIILLSFNIKPT
jgi:hypothetical protein